uniref:Uncharacterized protein n=1 Tax=viral metagenome TaxID=1070528 RepID=A0A6H1ZUC9_9ZZZZ
MRFSKKDTERVCNLIIARKLTGGSDTIYRYGLNRSEDKRLVLYCLRRLVKEGKVKTSIPYSQKKLRIGDFSVIT